jgi:hypothetical protein
METMWWKTMSSFLRSECTESANICIAPPTAQTANTSLTDEAQVHLPVSQQRHRCQLTELKSHKTALTILRQTVDYSHVWSNAFVPPPLPRTSPKLRCWTENIWPGKVSTRRTRDRGRFPVKMGISVLATMADQARQCGTGGVKLVNVKLPTRTHTPLIGFMVCYTYK